MSQTNLFFIPYTYLKMTTENEEQEKSESGAPIYRYDENAERPFTPATGNESSIEQISEHIERHIGPIESVFHELISDTIHIDVYWVKPGAERPYHTLVTSGMSDLPMNVPTEIPEHLSMQHTELCVLLPPEWQVEKILNHQADDEQTEQFYWPIRWLKIIARFPHQLNTWIGYGHTIPNGEDAEPFAMNTELGCILLLPSVSLGPDFFTLDTKEGKHISFYATFPLYREEMDFKMKKGVDALLARLESEGIDDVVDLGRKNVCRKKFLGLF